MFCSVNSSLSSHQVKELFRLSYYVHQESGESLTSLNEIKALNIQGINNNNVSNKHLGFYYFTPIALSLDLSFTWVLLTEKRSRQMHRVKLLILYAQGFPVKKDHW